MTQVIDDSQGLQGLALPCRERPRAREPGAILPVLIQSALPLEAVP